MPTNLVDDNSSYPASIQAPSAGDPRTDTSVSTPLQMLANRTANITARLDVIAAGTKLGYAPPLPAGVTVGTVSLNASSVVAMQSIPAANRVDGMTCIVKDLETFQFDIFSTQAAVANQCVQPTDVIGGSPGRWIVQPSGLYGVANGLPQLDASARLPAPTVRNGIVGLAGVTATTFVTTSPSYVDITGCTVTLTGLAIGDVVQATFSSMILPPASTSQATSYALYVVRPDTTSLLLQELSVLIGTVGAGPDRMQGNLLVTYVCTQAGSHTFKAQGKSPTGSAATFGLPSISVLAVRP